MNEKINIIERAITLLTERVTGDLAIDMSNSSLLVVAKLRGTAVRATQPISTPKTRQSERSTSSDSEDNKDDVGKCSPCYLLLSIIPQCVLTAKAVFRPVSFTYHPI